MNQRRSHGMLAGVVWDVGDGSAAGYAVGQYLEKRASSGAFAAALYFGINNEIAKAWQRRKGGFRKIMPQTWAGKHIWHRKDGTAIGKNRWRRRSANNIKNACAQHATAPRIYFQQAAGVSAVDGEKMFATYHSTTARNASRLPFWRRGLRLPPFCRGLDVTNSYTITASFAHARAFAHSSFLFSFCVRARCAPARVLNIVCRITPAGRTAHAARTCTSAPRAPRIFTHGLAAKWWTYHERALSGNIIGVRAAGDGIAP